MKGHITTEFDGLKFEGRYCYTPYNIQVIMTEPYGIYVPLSANILFPVTQDDDSILALAEKMLQRYAKTLIEVARNRERYEAIVYQYESDREPELRPIDYVPLCRQGVEFFGYDRCEKEALLKWKYNETMRLDGVPVIPIRAVEILLCSLADVGDTYLKQDDGKLPPPYLELYTSTIA